MKKFLLGLVVSVFVSSLVFFVYYRQTRERFLSPLGLTNPISKPLLAYTLESLKHSNFLPSQIVMGDTIFESKQVISKTFYFFVPQKPKEENTLKVSGVLNTPAKSGVYPVIIMLRGYVPKESYKSGIGSQPAANVFAGDGFITIAPDFLGYGQSASPSADAFEERFQTYTTVLTLISSLSNLLSTLQTETGGKVYPDLNKIGLWGHSNGGQIALSILAITGKSYPTVLWAPVSKSFPYSILYYTDEADDHGKALRKKLADFERVYDTSLFAFTNYLDWIKAPLVIHQGTSDQEVPFWWSDEFVGLLRKNQKEVKYVLHPGANHNLLPGGWSKVVSDSVNFYLDSFDRK